MDLVVGLELELGEVLVVMVVVLVVVGCEAFFKIDLGF